MKKTYLQKKSQILILPVLLLVAAVFLTACVSTKPCNASTRANQLQNQAEESSDTQNWQSAGESRSDSEVQSAESGSSAENIREVSTDYKSQSSHLSFQCKTGTFTGLLNQDEIASFKGIPYALPPVGSRRWKKAEPVPEGSGQYDAFEFKNMAAQCRKHNQAASYFPNGEDCLYLNIWLNGKNHSRNKTVMVYIHGGAFGWGGSAEPVLDGTNLVTENDDVILVTLDYRLGIFGFIDFSGTEGGEAYKDSSVLGLLDIIEALRWIKANISAFGGNPENITLFGQSAGATSISLLCVMDEAKGLFNRAILESGSVNITYSKEQCKKLASRLLKSTHTKNMEELAALDEDTLKKASRKLKFFYSYPQRDYFEKDLYQLYDEGKAAGYDILCGTNEDEVLYWKKTLGAAFLPGLSLIYSHDLKRLPEKERRLWKDFKNQNKKSSLQNKIHFENEMIFRLPMIRLAEAQAKNGSHCYMYYWTYPENKKAIHTYEIPFVFGNSTKSCDLSKGFNQLVSKAVQQYWVNFARTGNPNFTAFWDAESEDTENQIITNVPEIWPEYDEKTRSTLIISVPFYTEDDPLKESRLQLMPLTSLYLNAYYADLFD